MRDADECHWHVSSNCVGHVCLSLCGLERMSYEARLLSRQFSDVFGFSPATGNTVSNKLLRLGYNVPSEDEVNEIRLTMLAFVYTLGEELWELEAEEFGIIA